MIAVVEPDPACPPALVADALDRRGLDWCLVRAPAGDPLPAPASALIVLGGRAGAYEEADHPELGVMKGWIREFTDADKPVLGICLGAQLIADALGGRAFLADSPEVGLLPVELVADDPLTPYLSGRWLFHHQDTFELPPGAELKARSAHPAVFRAGSATAVQFHPEVTRSLVEEWSAASTLLEPAGVARHDLLRGWAVADADLTGRGVALVGAWIDQELGEPKAVS